MNHWVLSAFVYIFGTVRSQPVTEIAVCLLLERNTSTIFDYDRSRAAIEMGVQYVNDNVLPSSHVLTTHYVDIGTSCSAKQHIIGYAMQLRESAVDCNVYVGPGCGAAAEILYDVADFYDTPMIGLPAAAAGISAPFSEYENMVRLSITYTSISDVVAHFLIYQNYTTPVFLQDYDASFFKELNTVLVSVMKERYWDLYRTSKFASIQSPREPNIPLMHTKLRQYAKISRVILWIANADIIRAAMIVAQEEGLTNGDFVFLAVELYPSPVWGSFTWRKGDEDDERARSAFGCLLLVSLYRPPTDSSDVFWEDVKRLSLKRYNYTLEGSRVVDPVVVHSYETIVFYGNIVKDLIAVGRDYKSSEVFGRKANSYSFVSPISGQIKLNNESERGWCYLINTFVPTSGSFEPYLGFLPTFVDDGKVDRLGDLKDWPSGGGQLPPNQPLCGFTGDDPACLVHTGNVAIPVVVSLSLVAVVVVLGALFGVRRWQLQERESSTVWKIYHSDVEEVSRTSERSETTMTATILSRSVGMTEEKAKSRMADTSGSSVAPMDYAALEDRIGKVYLYHGMPLQARQLPEPRQRDSYNVHREVKLVQMLQHWNLQKIVGILIDDDNKCQAVLGELCSRGTLHHLIHDDKFDLDFQFKYSLVENLVSGMAYLQTTVVKSHGILSSFHCLIDGRFVLKISGYGMPVLVSPNWLVPPTDNMSDKQLYFYLWRAPEHLRERMPPSGSQKGDIYSFAIIVQQILLQSDPFKMGKLSENRSSVPVRDIVMEVKRGSTPPLRPPLPASVTAPEMRDLLEECWQEDPSLRPSFAMFKASMLQMLVRNKISTVGLVDHLIKKMEKYSLELEKQVEQKTNQFMEEKERSRNILDQILPKSIAKSLIQGTISAPETFECVTVCFADIPGFANFVKSLASRPHDYLDALNILQDTYETIVEQRDVFRVECLYDALLLVSGLPNRNGTHATEIAETAVGLLKSVANTKLSLAPSHILRLRVGMHTGPCVAGIVGSKLPKYCIFGDTVNTASRMETNSIAGKIQCTQKTKELLPESPLFKVVHRGNIEVKGKGLMDVYWIEPQL